MKASGWLTLLAAIGAALPFGWGLGVAAAYLVAGSNFGQLPALTVPLGLLAALGFAVLPVTTASKRLKILLAGDLLFLFLALLSR
jgi:hypothetical protein